MFTDTDYSTKNNPSVDRAIYLITMVSHYLSKKKCIIFIYKFVDLIHLARPANRRKGLTPPPPPTETTYWVLYERHLIKCRLTTGANLISSREVFSDEIL